MKNREHYTFDVVSDEQDDNDEYYRFYLGLHKTVKTKNGTYFYFLYTCCIVGKEEDFWSSQEDIYGSQLRVRITPKEWEYRYSHRGHMKHWNMFSDEKVEKALVSYITTMCVEKAIFNG